MTDQVVPESWYIPRALSNEALRLLTSLPMDEIERRLRMDGPAVLEGREPAAVEGQPSDSWLATHALPLMEPPAHLALERYGVTWDGSPDKPLLTRMADGYWTPWHVAADLLKRLALRPIPVIERLPGPEDCQPWPDEPDADPWCWLGSNFFDGGWEWEQRSVQFLRHYGNEYTHWLPAHALPLPEVNHD